MAASVSLRRPAEEDICPLEYKSVKTDAETSVFRWDRKSQTASAPHTGSSTEGRQEEERTPVSGGGMTGEQAVATEISESSEDELGRLDIDLDRKSKQHNLTSSNVRAILHEVITHEHVVAMMKAAIRDTQDLPMFEPKMTRSRLKQAVQQGQPLNWSLSAVNTVKPPQFVDIDLEEDEDSSDEEYCPDEEEEEDDTTEETFLSDADSFASPPKMHCSQPRLPADHTADEVLQRSPGYLREEVMTSTCAPQHLLPAPTESSFLERLNAVEEELDCSPAYTYNQSLDRKADDDDDDDEGSSCLAYRTRSKLRLVNVPLGQLEAELLAPDITADMYDQGTTQLEEDRHWTRWLRGLMAPDSEEEADDDDDPEYNFLDDLDEPDLEDYRTDRAVQITKKEVNELLEELFDTLQEEEEEEVAVEKEEQEEEAPPQTGPKFNIPQALRFEAPLASMLTERRRTVRKQYEALQQRRALQDTTNHQRDNMNLKDTPNPQPDTVTSVVVLPSQVCPTLHLDYTQKLQLQQQIQQHVQLLTQVHLLSRRVDALNHEACITKHYLEELQQFARRQEEVFLPSCFRVCNLRPALDLLQEEEQREEPPAAPLAPAASRRWLPTMTPATNSHAFPLLPTDTAWLFATRPVFLYPELLPVCSLDPALHTRHHRSVYTAGEDGLIILGLKHFEGTVQPDQLISSYLLCKTRWNFRKHVREMSSSRVPHNNVIKAFLTQGVVPPLPLACSRIQPGDQRPPVDRKTSTMPNWLKNSQQIIQRTRMNTCPPRYPPSLPQGCTLRLHPYWHNKSSRPPPPPHRRLFTLAHNASLLPLCPADRQVDRPADRPADREVDVQPISYLAHLPAPDVTLPTNAPAVSGALPLAPPPPCGAIPLVAAPHVKLPTNAPAVSGALPSAPPPPCGAIPLVAAPHIKLPTNAPAVSGALPLAPPPPCGAIPLVAAPHVKLSTNVPAVSGSLPLAPPLPCGAGPVPTHPLCADIIQSCLPIGQRSISRQQDSGPLPLLLPLPSISNPNTTNPIMPCSSAVVKPGYVVLQMVWTPSAPSTTTATSQHALGQKLHGLINQEQEEVEKTCARPRPQAEADRQVEVRQVEEGGDKESSTSTSTLSSCAGAEEEEEEEEEEERSWTHLGVVCLNGGENGRVEEERREAGGGEEEERREAGGAGGAGGGGEEEERREAGGAGGGGEEEERREAGGAGGGREEEAGGGGEGEQGGEGEEEEEGQREDGEGERDEDGEKDKDEDQDRQGEEEEEEDFDDLTQDEDEEEVMSSASEESVLSVPELQETMKQLTWLASERRLCADGDSEEDHSPTSPGSQEEEEEEEEEGPKGEESGEGRSIKAGGDEETPSCEGTPRGGGRCTGRGRGRSRPLRGLRRSRQERHSKDAAKLLLLYDENLLDNDPHRESKDVAFAQSYLNRVREALQDVPGKVEEFVSLLNEFELVGEGQQVIVLFRKLRCILGNRTDLLRDFAAFMHPEQALECGLFEEQQAFERSRRFLRQLEISFGDNPSHYQKIIKALQAGPDLSPTSIHELKAQMATLLKGHTHLQAEFWVFFDELRPPPARPGQFEEAHWPEEGGGGLDSGEGVGSGSGGGASCGFEEVTLPELEEEEEGHKIQPMASRRQRRKMDSHRNYKDCDWSDKDWPCLCHDAKIRRHRRKGCSRCHGNKSSGGVSRAMKSLDPLYAQIGSTHDESGDKDLDLKGDDSPQPDRSTASWEGSFPLTDEKEEEEDELDDEEDDEDEEERKSSEKEQSPALKKSRREEALQTPSTSSVTPSTSSITSSLTSSTPSLIPPTSSLTSSITSSTPSLTPPTSCLTSSIPSLTPSTTSLTSSVTPSTSSISSLTTSTSSVTSSTPSISSLTTSTSSVTPSISSLTTSTSSVTSSTPSISSLTTSTSSVTSSTPSISSLTTSTSSVTSSTPSISSLTTSTSSGTSTSSSTCPSITSSSSTSSISLSTCTSFASSTLPSPSSAPPRPSPPPDLPVCAKNISLTASGEKVILWTREADRVILTTCQQEGANQNTFQAISSLLGNKTPSEVSRRFRDLMRLFRTAARQTSSEDEAPPTDPAASEEQD